jgi:hypothetical protein
LTDLGPKASIHVPNQPLPKTRLELLRIVDPHGKEYPSLESFERDFQRQREDFWEMAADAERELRGNGNSSKAPA